MSTGLGIFLGSMFISIAILYSSTKDRWNWKKIVKWFSSLLIITLLGVGMTFYFLIRKEDPGLNIERITELSNVKLNAPFEDARYSFGEPTQIDTCNSDKCDTIVSWEKEKETIDVYLFENKIQEIRVFKTEYGEIPRVFGINEYSSEYDIERAIGKGEWRKTNHTDWRKLSYDSLNVQWYFKNGNIKGISIYNP